MALRFTEEFSFVPAMFYLLLGECWGKMEEKRYGNLGGWTPSFSEPVVLVALYAQPVATIKEMGNYIGNVNYSQSALRNSCARLEQQGLVTRVGRSNYHLTDEGRVYVAAAIDKTCSKMGIRFDGIVFQKAE